MTETTTSAPRTILFAGGMGARLSDSIMERVTTDWRVLTWTDGDDPARFHELLAEAEAVVGGRVDAEWSVPAPGLKLYQVPFTGVEWISPEELPKGCVLCNTFEHEITMAEYVMAGLLEWEIGMRASDQHFREKGWDRHLPGSGVSHGELYEKTVGIVGYGHIGREVAIRAKAFGMTVKAVSRTARDTPAELDWFGTLDELDRLLGESDYVVVTLPLTRDTKDMFDTERFGKLKSNGVIINVGRGRVINEEALYQALLEKRIGGAIIDVWYGYPSQQDLDRSPTNFPFQDLENIIMTPHNSATTEAMRLRRLDFVARNIDHLARGEALENVCFEGIA
ncbi:MAG: phosphoglycerate dehydrogenase [Alphaproteobacteria bacterium]|nr:phosphoglycerate dehydrogenase [Alphaproteobacteria bacterium]